MRTRGRWFAAVGTPPPLPPPPPPPPPPAAPDAPTDFTATVVDGDRVDLTWTDNATNEQGYRVYRSGGLYASMPAGTEAYSAFGNDEGVSYEWEVAAYNASGEGLSGVLVRVMKLNTPTSLFGQQQSGYVEFTFVDNSGLEGNNVLQRNGADYSVGAPDQTVFQVTDAEAVGTFRVQARAGSYPDSEYSNEVSGPPWPV